VSFQAAVPLFKLLFTSEKDVRIKQDASEPSAIVDDPIKPYTIQFAWQLKAMGKSARITLQSELGPTFRFVPHNRRRGAA
jgi:hypothetical protein